MIDPGVLRTQTDGLAAELLRRGLDVDMGTLAELDEKRRATRASAEELRAEQKRRGQEISKLDGAEKEKAIADAGQLADDYKQALAEADELDTKFMELWVALPNFAHESVPEGQDDEDNVEVSKWGEPPDFDFEPKDHLDLGEALGVIDVERAAKVSGARFAYRKGKLASLEFALVRWSMDRLTSKGFTPVIPPVLVREEALFGTGFFPEARDQVYSVPADDLFLAGTAEIPLAAMHTDEILDPDQLPMRYVGFSTCFRREAGTYGKDMRGIFRTHQFDKVEMFVFTTPEQSWEEHEFLLAQEEALVQDLGLPYRVVNVCLGDLGAPAAKKYDIEVWLPGQGRYRELTSCSNTTDYQARRLKIRSRTDDGTVIAHTLNGTVVTSSRTLIAIMENYQQADGSIEVPAALVPYAGFDTIE